MSDKHGKKTPLWDKIMKWCSILGALFVVLAAVPALPWRYSKVDTNMGNRFVMERYYFMTGASNNLGKTEGWMSLRRKLQRKNEEFGKPSPITAILGTVTQVVGAGGAAMGCAMWMACKEHLNVRYMQFTTVAYASIAFLILVLLSAFAAAGTVVYLGFQNDAEKKAAKKKKKKDDDCMEPASKTMTAAILAFVFSFTSTAGFVVITGSTLDRFKESAYYPYAGAHAAPFVAGFGCFLLFISACTATNRVFKCCGHKKEEQGGEQGEWGAPPGAYGAPPPGAYGAYPPGAYGAGQQW